GVTSFSSTSSHKPCASAGRRPTAATAAATSANNVASTALLKPRNKRCSTGGSFQTWGKKGVRHLLCEAPSGPFRQKVPDPFFAASHLLCAPPSRPFPQTPPDPRFSPPDASPTTSQHGAPSTRQPPPLSRGSRSSPTTSTARTR